MKRTITSCLTLLLTVTLTFAGIKVTSKVTFGAKSKGCKGAGICHAESTRQTGALPTTWEYNPDQNILILDIPEEEAEGQINPENIFIQQEHFDLPADLCRKLGAEGVLTIPSGKYSAIHLNGRFRVSFKVVEN